MSSSQRRKSLRELSPEEIQFLELPASRLALELDLKRRKREGKPTAWERISGVSIKRVLAVSAFVAAIFPLVELNKAAVDFVLKRRELDSILNTAEALIGIDAISAGQAELNRAQKIDASNTRLLRLQSVVELEETLRTRQDVRSLRSLEIRYAQILPESAPASYLLGTAYIGWDLDVAEKYLAQAERIDRGRTPTLAVQVIAGRVWALSRRLQKTSDRRHLDAAAKLFEQAKTIVARHPDIDFSRPLIALYTNYSFVADARVRLKEPPGELTPLQLSRLSFSQALKTGNALLIGKSAKALAEKLKDSGQDFWPESRAMVVFALQNLRAAEDKRGLYTGNYTLGQVDYLLKNQEKAKAAFLLALEGAMQATDYRIEILTRTYLARLALLRSDWDEASLQIRTGRMLAGETGDTYGRWELQLIEAFQRVAAERESYSGDHFTELCTEMPKEFGDLHETARQWRDYLSAMRTRAASPERPLLAYDPRLEEALLPTLSSRNP